MKYYVIDARFGAVEIPPVSMDCSTRSLMNQGPMPLRYPRSTCVVRRSFPHVADTQSGPFEGKRVDRYYLIMTGRGPIRVTGGLTPPPLGHCVEEECDTQDDSREREQRIIIFYLHQASIQNVLRHHPVCLE